MHSLLDYRRNVYSQNGEDGVIAEIMRRWGISDGWFCEFGAWDGKYGSNSYALLKQGWRGVMIEGDADRFQALARTARKFPDRLSIRQAFVAYEDGPSSLDSLLAETPIPQDFDLLSIDIDSYDYQVWQSFVRYRPKLVVVEIDSSMKPGERSVYDGHRTTSFTAMLELGQSKGYTAICHTGNMFFAANEHIGTLALDRETLTNPDSLFIPDWVSPTKSQVWRRKIRNMTWQRAVTKIENMMLKR